MKKLFFASMALTAILASCSGNTEPVAPETGGADPDVPQVRITLRSDPVTRAFFDETAAAEPWEKRIAYFTVYVFDESGDFVVRRRTTASEAEARSVRVTLPNSVAGTTCSFHVVANADYGDAATVSAMERKIEGAALDEYNGAFDRVSRESERPDGPVMNGKATAAVAPAGSSTAVGVTLGRTVAKVAVRARTDASFAAAHGGGTVVVTSARISGVSAASRSFFRPGDYPARTSLYAFAQSSEVGEGCSSNLFYLYENDRLAAGSRVKLTLTGYFDADGDLSGAADRSQVEYVVELEGSGEGRIERNAYYRVEAVIRGLSGDAVNVDITVADWETPVSQSVDPGV